MSITGERSQEKQARNKSDEQELHKTQQDKSVNKHQVLNTALKTDTNLLKSQKDTNCKISCNHNNKKQQNNRTEVSNVNVSSEFNSLFEWS